MRKILECSLLPICPAGDTALCVARLRGTPPTHLLAIREIANFLKRKNKYDIYTSRDEHYIEIVVQYR